MNTREYLETREQLSRAKEDFDRLCFHGQIAKYAERSGNLTMWGMFVAQWALTAQRLRAYEELQAEIALRLSLKRGRKSA